jgi:hypothetical protein
MLGQRRIMNALLHLENFPYGLVVVIGQDYTIHIRWHRSDHSPENTCGGIGTGPWRILRSSPHFANYRHTQGKRTRTPFDTRDLQQAFPIPATGFAFHYEAHLPWMLLQQ